MRYWAHQNNEVRGPFEKEQLAALPGFTLASLIFPESPVDGKASAWKAASTYPEVADAINNPAPAPTPAPAPVKPRPVVESPLAMTMRGTLIDTPVVDGHVAETPAPAARPAAESPLAMTMRGTLIEPQAAAQAEPVKPAPAAMPAIERSAPEVQPEPVKQKLEQMSAMLASIGNGQSQLFERLDRIEAAVAEVKALIAASRPK